MNEDISAKASEVLADVDEHPQRRREWSGVWMSLVLPVLIVAAIVAALWYWQSRGGGSAQPADGLGIVVLPAEKNPTGREPAAEKGRAAPDFVLATLDGSTLRLSDLQGRPVIINFWATWCAPCRQEMPEFVRTASEHQNAGLAILAVNLKESDTEVQRFTSEFGVTFPVLLDRAGVVASTYRVTGLPVTYFIDRSGVIREVSIGPLDRAALQQKLATILS